MARSTASSVSVHVTNVVWLSILVIGGPFAATFRLGNYHISSFGLTGQLMLCLLAIGGLINIGFLCLVRSPSSRRSAKLWLLIFLFLSITQASVFYGLISFQWLRDALRVIVRGA